MMSLKEVMILFAIFSLGIMLPGKHWLIETEDGGDDSRGVTENKSKILDYHTSIALFFADSMENKSLKWKRPCFLGKNSILPCCFPFCGDLIRERKVFEVNQEGPWDPCHDAGHDPGMVGCR